MVIFYQLHDTFKDQNQGFLKLEGTFQDIGDTFYERGNFFHNPDRTFLVFAITFKVLGTLFIFADPSFSRSQFLE